MRFALAPPLRPARLSDAARLAELVNYAGEGMPLYLWGKLATPETSAWEVGRQRAARETGGFSYKNAVMIEAEGEVAGCLIVIRFPSRPNLCPRVGRACFGRCRSLRIWRRQVGM